MLVSSPVRMSNGASDQCFLFIALGHTADMVAHLNKLSEGLWCYISFEAQYTHEYGGHHERKISSWSLFLCFLISLKSTRADNFAETIFRFHLLFYFCVYRDWVSYDMMIFQMLINLLKTVTWISGEAKREAKSKWSSMIYNPGEVREEACLVTFMMNFAGGERERWSRGWKWMLAFSRLRMPHYLRWCESHQGSLLWSSVLNSGDGGDPLQGWGHSRSVLLIWLLRGACVTKGMHLSLPLR